MPDFVTPNQYHLAGKGISVSYFPNGEGPILAEHGAVKLVYNGRPFRADAVRTKTVDDLGTVVSVTIAAAIDTGSTTFSLLIPDVELPGLQSSAFIRTKGITTVRRASVALIGHPQAETYSVTELDGTASLDLLPLVTKAG
jgi:hypothetical protein